MSDRKSKKHDGATKPILSRVAEKTKSKRDAYFKTFSEAHMDATNASHGSGGVSAPIAPKKRKTISSSSKNVEKNGSNRLKTPQDGTRTKKSRIQSESTQAVEKSIIGNDNSDMDLEEITLERIDATQYYNMKKLAKSKIELSIKQETNEGFSGANSSKKVDSVSKRHSPKDAFSEGLSLQKGKNTENMVCKEIEMEKMKGVGFNAKNTHSISGKHGVKKGHFAATSGKNVSGVIKKIFSGSSSPDNVEPHFNQGSQKKSSSIRKKGKHGVNKGHVAATSTKNVSGIIKKIFGGSSSSDNAELNSNQGSLKKSSLIAKKGKLGVNKGHFAATSSKNVSGVIKKIFGGSSSPDNAELNSNQGSQKKSSSIAKKGIYGEDMDFKGIEIERSGKDEYVNHRACSMSKIGVQTMEESNECYSATTSRKKVGSASKNCLPPSDHEDTASDEIKIERVSEAEFRNLKAHLVSKNRSSTMQKSTKDHSAAASGKNVISSRKDILSKNVDGARKNIVPADLVYIFSGDSDSDSDDTDSDTDSDPLPDKRSPLNYDFHVKILWRVLALSTSAGTITMDTVFIFLLCNYSKFTSSKEIKITGTDEAELKNKASHIASKIGSSSRQELDERSAANSRKNSVLMKDEPFDMYSESSSSDEDDSDFAKGLIDFSSSFEETGNNEDDTDSDDIEIENIDESEFRNKATHSMPKIGSSARQELYEESFTATNAEKVISLSKTRSISSKKKNDQKKKKRKVSAYSRKKRNVIFSSSQCISSNSSGYSSSDIQQDDDEIRSYDAGHDNNLGIATRTRSRTRTTKNATDVKKVSFSDSSNDSGSDDEDFGMESSFNSDDIELQKCSNVGEREVQKNIAVEKASAEKSEDCDKQEGSAIKQASTMRNISTFVNKEANCNQPTSQRQNIQFIHDGSSSQQTKGKKARKTNEIHEGNEETNILGHDANADEGLKEKRLRKSINLPKFTFPKQSCTEKNCNEEEGDNKLHTKDQSQAGVEEAISPSHSKMDSGNSDEDIILEKLDPTSSDIHGHDKNEKIDVADEIKKPMESKQVSPRQYDLCRMLADSVLGRGPVIETKESDEKEAKQAPVSQTQSSLPLKFGFEDEVPKQVEKTEYEKEVDGLFDELDFWWASQELGSFNHPEVDRENKNSSAEETPYAQCSRGKHELVVVDDQGLICIFCHHVELGPKHVMAEWEEKIYQVSHRKRLFETERLSEFDGLHSQPRFDNFADSNNVATGTVWSIKPGIRASMYEHQQEGFEFLWKNLAGSMNLNELKSTNSSHEVGGCIISHAPGTGKTRLTIVFIETYMKVFPNCLPVIIAPASMLLTWEEEFRKWNVDFPFINLNNLEVMGQENKRIFSGAKRQNMNTIRMINLHSWNAGGEILGISYSLFEKLTGEKYLNEKSNKKKTPNFDNGTKEYWRKILLEKPGLVVLDEGHTPRNQRSNIWNVLLKLQTEKRVILSGTPFQNNFGELFNTLRLVRPAIADALAQEKAFAEMITSRRISSKRKHMGEIPESAFLSEVDDRALERLKIAMSPFVHVHEGTILQQNLPGLRDCVVLLKPPPLQKSLIDRLERIRCTFQFEHRAALISVHPYLFQHSTEEERKGVDLAAVETSKLNPNEGVKTKFILEFVRLITATNEKVLIFSLFLQPLELIREQLKEIFKWVNGKQILLMEGKLDQKQRQTLINVFNDPQSESKVMLASTKCCSEGISLVGASRVILLDVVWNPSVETQAISRAYRIGQKKFVYTYHLMTSGTTEIEKYCRQAEKERMSELVFTSSSNESNKEKLPLGFFEDKILEVMVDHASLQGMFEKIINQPKETNLFQTFGLTC